MGFKAINDNEKTERGVPGETEEAREARIVKGYEQALQLNAQGHASDSLVRPVEDTQQRYMKMVHLLDGMPLQHFTTSIVKPYKRCFVMS